jgi:hypothetical protein
VIHSLHQLGDPALNRQYHRHHSGSHGFQESHRQTLNAGHPQERLHLHGGNAAVELDAIGFDLAGGPAGDQDGG